MAKNQNQKLMDNIKTLETKTTNRSPLKCAISAEDECFKIIQTIWSCQNDEQKEGCENMLKTYIKKHGNDNLGITFIKLELKRLDKIIEMSKIRNKKMKEMQDALAKQQPEQPSQETLKQSVKDGSIEKLPKISKSKE
jgi:hypothetical protein